MDIEEMKKVFKNLNARYFIDKISNTIHDCDHVADLQQCNLRERLDPNEISPIINQDMATLIFLSQDMVSPSTFEFLKKTDQKNEIKKFTHLEKKLQAKFCPYCFPHSF